MSLKLASTVAVVLVGAAVAAGPMGGRVASAAVSASPRITRLDRRSVGRLVAAEYAIEKAWQASEPAAKAEVDAAERRLEGECKGVASGSLTEEEGPLGFPITPAMSARARGEEDREGRQRMALRSVVSAAVFAADAAPDREAQLALVHTLRSLRWSNGRIARVEHAEATLMEAHDEVPASAVCAALTAWADSGYTRLSPATKTFSARSEALTRVSVGDGLIALAPSPMRFADARERRLMHKLGSIARARAILEDNAEARIERALGLIGAEEAEFMEGSEAPPPRSSPAKKPSRGKRHVERRQRGGQQVVLGTILKRKREAGRLFSVSGIRQLRLHEVYIQLTVAGDDGVGSPMFVSRHSEPGEGDVSTPEGALPHAKPFALGLYATCRPRRPAIVYGLLWDTGDKVLARVAGRLVPLRRAQIPHSLNVHGVFVYRALPAVPSELLLRQPSGRLVVAQRLGKRVREAREFCEGEAEPRA